MKTYYIYDFQTDKLIHELRAYDIVDAEIKACIELKRGSGEIYALSDKC